MRALFTSLPAMGHLNSILPLAIAARRAGHDVAVCTSAGLVDEVTGHGLEHLPGGALTLDELLPADVPRYGPDRTARVRLEVFGKAAPVRLMADLEPHVRDWRPDVLIRESAEYAAGPTAIRSPRPRAAGRSVRRARNASITVCSSSRRSTSCETGTAWGRIPTSRCRAATWRSP